MKRYIALAVIASCLTGCLTLTPEQIEARKKQFEANQQQWCAERGAPKGSKDYYQCRRDLTVLLMEDERQRRAESSAAINAYLDREQRSEAAMWNSRSRMTNCTSSSWGSDVRTTCF